MIGLKSYLPVLSGHLNTTEDVLYERQRKLTRAGLLVGSTGRGPGSGIRVTPPVVTLMILAIMATDNLADVDTIVQKLASQKSDAARCPLTDAATFGEALGIIFASEGIASAVRSIEVPRSALHGEIIYQRRGRRSYDGSSFGRQRFAHDDPARHRLRINATLPGETVQAISNELASIAAGKKLQYPVRSET